VIFAIFSGRELTQNSPLMMQYNPMGSDPEFDTNRRVTRPEWDWLIENKRDCA
jgi:hypothetical protein